MVIIQGVMSNACCWNLPPSLHRRAEIVLYGPDASVINRLSSTPELPLHILFRSSAAAPAPAPAPIIDPQLVAKNEELTQVSQ